MTLVDNHRHHVCAEQENIFLKAARLVSTLYILTHFDTRDHYVFEVDIGDNCDTTVQRKPNTNLESACSLVIIIFELANNF